MLRRRKASGPIIAEVIDTGGDTFSYRTESEIADVEAVYPDQDRLEDYSQSLILVLVVSTAN